MLSTFRVSLVVTWADGTVPRFSQAPRSLVRTGRAWIVAFDVEDESSDTAVGRLWGETVACGVKVLAVVQAQPAA